MLPENLNMFRRELVTNAVSFGGVDEAAESVRSVEWLLKRKHPPVTHHHCLCVIHSMFCEEIGFRLCEKPLTNGG